MPLNQQLQPVTEYVQFNMHGRLQYAWPLIGLEHAMSCVKQELMLYMWKVILQ